MLVLASGRVVYQSLRKRLCKKNITNAFFFNNFSFLNLSPI